MFGNPLDARKFCNALKEKGSMTSWIKKNGGGSYIEPPPVYKRIPTKKQILEEIYSVAKDRVFRATQQKVEMEEMRKLVNLELNLDSSGREEADLTEDGDGSVGADSRGGGNNDASSKQKRRRRSRRSRRSSSGPSISSARSK